MLVAACLLASSLTACDGHRPGTAPRLRPRSVRITSPLPRYDDAVSARMGFTEPRPERFGRPVYVSLPAVVYGDGYEELPAVADIPERSRAGRKARRDVALGQGKVKVKKTRAVVSQQELAYATPTESGNWLTSIFGGVYSGDESVKNEPATNAAGYDAVRAAARRYGPGGKKFEKLARDITYTESRGRCGAVSSAKALGVMQTKYGTARMMGYKGSAEGLKNCRTGAEWGVKYLAYCHDLAKGDVRLTSVCYNQGHGVLTNPRKYGKRAERKEALNYIATMRSQGWGL